MAQTQRQREWPPIPAPVRGRIAVVGICAAGKTTLVEELRRRGLDARQCGQEHSHIPDMWRRISRPEVLVYLHASADVVRQRRAFAYPEARHQAQVARLEHARAHCDLFLDTDHLSAEEVLADVLAFLQARGLAH